MSYLKGDRSLLSAQQEIDLAGVIQSLPSGPERDASCNELVLANLRLVGWVMRRYPHVRDRDDFAQTCRLALVKSAKAYDPANHPGVRFAAYASVFIFYEVTEYFRSPQIVRTPNYLSHRGDGPTRFRTEASQLRYCRKIAKAALARKPHLSLVHESKSEQDPIDGLGGTVLEPADPNPSSAKLACERAETVESISHLLFWLTPIQRYVITEHFGLLSREPRTFTDIARSIGLSAERISNIEHRALDILRDEIRKDPNHCAFHDDGNLCAITVCG